MGPFPPIANFGHFEFLSLLVLFDSNSSLGEALSTDRPQLKITIQINLEHAPIPKLATFANMNVITLTRKRGYVFLSPHQIVECVVCLRVVLRTIALLATI